ncbi:putative kinase-like protein TMKL1 [Amborella trichopoda]|uniref:Protein kinase domain-containing protein n=1 Tax=Amborella trichopoda TaxID=13333 RepID=W1NTU4_AMBTC|nr:putative kinase-like protein TMKL1 [Amborella trichopoda]ERM98034.1 hypothetical protein AMTR_s00120p00076230 [Amborella trichopoda]|eukprot:XP_006830618.1 putative kinase-like protein TMKL1 [Amborella trichopoda]
MAPSPHRLQLPLSPYLVVSLLFYLYFSVLLHTANSQNSDVILLLQSIKPALQGQNQHPLLSTWNLSTPLCQWRGLKWGFQDGSSLSCENPSSKTNLSLARDPNLQLLSLELPASGLVGQISPEMVKLSSLQSLFLGVNSLSGPIPLELGSLPSLSEISLNGNNLSGNLPPSIWNLCDKLLSLQINGNQLSGSVPEPALPNVTCPNLRALDMGNNHFEGVFPEFLLDFHGLQELNLANNLFSGPIPEGLSGLDLQKLNLSHNNFTGNLPSFRTGFGSEAFEGNNPSLCGSPLKSCRSGSKLSSGAIAGIVIGLMAGMVVLASVLIGLVQGRKRKSRDEETEEIGEDEQSGEGRLIVFQGGEHLTLDEVLNATGQVMEKSSYGTVYKAKLAEGATIALRLLREGTCREGDECLSVIRELGRSRHENLVPLRAFYQGERGEKLLIYDYLPHRTLSELLHENRAGRPQMSWARRHKIALGIARGLAHLHSGGESPIIHGNLKSKNTLVDESFVAHLTDFGIVKAMVPQVADEMLAATKLQGYKAPELQKMKKCSVMTDVYSFGIILLEILLGKKPGKDARTGEQVDLPSIVKVAVLEESTMEVFDAEVLRGVRSAMEEGLVQALKLAMGCCAPAPSVRPDMAQVVRQLEENRPRNRSALYSPAETRSGTGTHTPF